MTSSFFSAEIARVQAAGREALRVEVEVAPHVVGEAHGVGLVVDRERRPQPEHRRLAAQDARARGVERRHPHAARDRADERGDALLHLARGLVGERDREDLERRHVAFGDEVRDAVREHAGLARPGAGDDEQRAVGARPPRAGPGSTPRAGPPTSKEPAQVEMQLERRTLRNRTRVRANCCGVFAQRIRSSAVGSRSSAGSCHARSNRVRSAFKRDGERARQVDLEREVAATRARAGATTGRCPSGCGSTASAPSRTARCCGWSRSVAYERHPTPEHL